MPAKRILIAAAHWMIILSALSLFLCRSVFAAG